MSNYNSLLGFSFDHNHTSHSDNSFLFKKHRNTIPFLQHLLDLCLLFLVVGEDARPPDPHGSYLSHPFQIHVEQRVMDNTLWRARLPWPVMTTEHRQRQPERHYNYSVFRCHLNLLEHVERVIEAVVGAGGLWEAIWLVERGLVVGVVRLIIYFFLVLGFLLNEFRFFYRKLWTGWVFLRNDLTYLLLWIFDRVLLHHLRWLLLYQQWWLLRLDYLLDHLRLLLDHLRLLDLYGVKRLVNLVVWYLDYLHRKLDLGVLYVILLNRHLWRHLRRLHYFKRHLNERLL